MKPKQFKPRLREADQKFTLDIIRSIDDLLDLRQPVPMTAAIYFLFAGDEVVYVGQSLDVTRRLIEHRMGKLIAFDTVSVVPVPPEHLDYFERMAISAYEPRHNLNAPRIPNRLRPDGDKLIPTLAV